jgi:hypothetical protein
MSRPEGWMRRAESIVVGVAVLVILVAYALSKMFGS